MPDTSVTAPPTESREARFVIATLAACQRDKGLAARLRRADNPTTEYQSWDFLARFGINLDRDTDRVPFATVACAIARAKAETNGHLSLGKAIATCYPKEKKEQSDQAVARLRRLLACGELAELCRILRPVLTLVESRVGQPLDYTLLLRQLRRFGFAAAQGDEDALQRVKAQWAQAFYARQTNEEATA